ncbi:MAG: hypothetical protein Q8S84_00175 [bacterium]|nr:hypothetical protein [bacterium]MDP3380006.1 hypothetical protein [bacterium]
MYTDIKLIIKLKIQDIKNAYDILTKSHKKYIASHTISKTDIQFITFNIASNSIFSLGLKNALMNSQKLFIIEYKV